MEDGCKETTNTATIRSILEAYWLYYYRKNAVTLFHRVIDILAKPGRRLDIRWIWVKLALPGSTLIPVQQHMSRPSPLAQELIKLVLLYSTRSVSLTMEAFSLYTMTAGSGTENSQDEVPSRQ